MVEQFVRWLGPRGIGVLAAVLGGTTLSVLGLQVVSGDESWVLSAQLGLVWVFLALVALVLSTHLPPRGRRRLGLALGPGLLLLGLGVVFPHMALFFGGAGLGWMVSAQFILRNRVRMEYQLAIRHMRQGDHAEAIVLMDDLITAEADDPNHYRFRAELYRLSGNLNKARLDYERVIELDSDSAAGYTGLAEVYAQQGDYERACTIAQQALERAPRQWLTAYNLGMIEDRLGDSASSLEHLDRALSAGLPHGRYRLLARLWMARNYVRQGQMEAGRQQLDLMRQQVGGLREWQAIFDSEQAAALRDLLTDDVRLAEQLLEGNLSLDVLGEHAAPAGK